MPASPSFPSDNRGKWKRRRRGEQQIGRKSRQEEEELEDDEEENNDDDLDNSEDQQNGTAALDPGPTETEVLAEGGVRISDFPAVVRRAVNRPHVSVAAVVAAERASLAGDTKGLQASLPVLENLSHGQVQALSAVPADSPVFDQERSDGAGGMSSAFVISPPPIMEGRGVIKRFGNRVHAVPMHSDWFSPHTVHRLERQVVPHFFSGKSPDCTPEKYMECRNYVVAKYMDNPERRLTVSDCQGSVDGVNNEDLTRIVRFLDNWGVINYCAAAPGREPWNDGSYLKEDPTGEVNVPSAALKSIDSLIKFDKPKCRLKAPDIYSSLSRRRDDDDVSDIDNRIRERLSENRCKYCSQALPVVYYQSQKEVDILLCADCFHVGRNVTGHSSIDFVRVDSTKDYGDLDGESWSDQETLLLLEAMEIYHENWNDIADHVGSKSKAQCILHFLRLPMEDGLLENIEVPSKPKSSSSSSRDDCRGLNANSNGDLPESCLQRAEAEIRLPFENSANPVMALVAFLASAVGPRVAAACAHASLAALSEDDGLASSGREGSGREGSGRSNRMNSESINSREGSFHGEIQQKEENSLHGSWGQNGAAIASLSADRVNSAAKAGLSAAAMKAKLFADHEEREIQRLSANIVNNQLKRLELKLKQFAEVETLLMKECEQVEKARQRFAAERTRMVAARFAPTGVSSQVSLPGVAPSMVNNNVGNNRQQVLSPSPSQPSISGYSNNQSVHPQMPFMPRQQVFPMGPRLPLNAMQPSPSSSSSMMFNAPGNPQPTLNHPMLRSMSGTSSGLG